MGGVLGGLQLAGIPYLGVLTPLPEVSPLVRVRVRVRASLTWVPSHPCLRCRPGP